MSQVVVYFYSGEWIPIMLSSLVEVIVIHRKALLSGQEIFVFPPDVDPCALQESLDSTVWQQATDDAKSASVCQS